MSKKAGLPAMLKMRHDAHYVESLASYSGAAVGRMIPVDQVRPNPDQPRKALGDLRELTESIRMQGVLQPLLVRFVPREGCYYIISGERRYHSARAAGLREVPAIEKTADDAETLEIALIENIQRKDLTPFEEADGLQRLIDTFGYTHDDVAKKIGRSRSSVSEMLMLLKIPDSIRKKCAEANLTSKSLLLEISKQPTEKKMLEVLARILHGGLTRDASRQERAEEKNGPQRPQPFVFQFEPENESFRFRLQFKKSHVSRDELVRTLREILAQLEGTEADYTAA
ncbi:MAG TPA: ParB/RepB/Spo0J family partition protein [Candidatus Acidoferrum sp.]|nr:ParB/RepB/Spo0J family partition protein [Candidatus Acidoferrum sp.]